MNTTEHIQHLLDRVSEGDSNARDALLARSRERIGLLAQRMFRTRKELRALDQTDDIISKAILRLHGSLLKVKPPNATAFFGLAARHIRWVLCDLIREHLGGRQIFYVADLEEAEAESSEPSSLAQWSEFHQAIERLPEEHRQLFDLIFYQGLSQTEVALLLNLCTRTVMRRWQRARIELNDLLKGDPPGGFLS